MHISNFKLDKYSTSHQLFSKVSRTRNTEYSTAIFKTVLLSCFRFTNLFDNGFRKVVRCLQRPDTLLQVRLQTPNTFLKYVSCLFRKRILLLLAMYRVHRRIITHRRLHRSNVLFHFRSPLYFASPQIIQQFSSCRP